MKSCCMRNTLFLPEGLVDEVPSKRHCVSSDAPCEALKMSPEEMKEQKKALACPKKNKIAREDERIAALKAAEESVNLQQQQEAYRKLEAENEAKRQNNDQTSIDFHHGQLERGGLQRNGNGNFGSGQGKMKHQLSSLLYHVDNFQVGELEGSPKHSDCFKFIEGEYCHILSCMGFAVNQILMDV